MLFEKIQQKIWGLSASAGFPPYTFISFDVDEGLRKSAARSCLKEYMQGIAFFIWEEYTLEEYRDYLEHSKEYMQIDNVHQREQFLQDQLARNKNREDLLQWQHNQMHIALGLAINELRRSVPKYKEIEAADIDLFKGYLQIRGCILKEVILL